MALADSRTNDAAFVPVSRGQLLLIEHDEAQRAATTLILSTDGWDVIQASEMADPETRKLLQMRNSPFDMIVAEFSSVADTNQRRVEEVKHIRRATNTPLIILSKHNEIDLRVGNLIAASLRAGADGYIQKPCRADELAARVEAVNRRANMQFREAAIAITDRLSLDPEKKIVLVDDCNTLPLTLAQFKILEALVSSRGTPVSNTNLLSAIDSASTENTVIKIHISQIKKKIDAALKEDGAGNALIQNVIGEGYKLSRPTTGQQAAALIAA